MRTYNGEQSLCDVVRRQRVPDLQVVVPAMRACVCSADYDPVKLMDYAGKLGVEKKIRGHLEVLL